MKSLWRNVGRWTLTLLSIWLVASTLVWAEGTSGVVNIVQALAAGAPWWSLGVPIIGLASLALLLRRTPGAYWVLFLLGMPLIGLAFASILPLENVPGLQVWWGSGLAVVAAFVYTLVAIAMAFGEAVPMDSPLLPIAYMGRAGHLRELYRLAESHGWQASGPGQPDHAVRVRGRYGDRELSIESGARYSATSYDWNYYYLWVSVRAGARPLAPFFLGLGVPGPGGAELKAALRGKARNDRGHATPFFLWPGALQPAEDADLSRVQAALESGRRFLRHRSLVLGTRNEVLYERQSSLRINEKAADVEQILQWLGGLADVLEQKGAGGAMDEGASPWVKGVS